MLKIICLTAALGAALGSTAQAADLQFDGRHARAETAANGSYVLHARTPEGRGEVRIAPMPMRSQTGSVMFDALFALAQQEMDQDRVDAIRDPAFDEGRPVPCECFQTGARWPYVWTRDVSFAADLALARLDPQRTRQSLQFKLSAARDGHTPGLFVAQDTGSGGSWPIVFDAQVGLYRGETSFLDWREQTYPDWTREDVRFIGDSYALSTNVLHYQALRLAERLAGQHGDARAADYKAWADALAQQIDARFWREDMGQYMSYIGEAAHPVPYVKVDLLGLSLGILAEVLPPERARRALAAYPMGPAGSPVVWPQESQQPIYHNRAIWPFVSAYSLRAARQLDDAPRIAAEIRSLMQGAALAGSNMENYEVVSQAVHVEEGALSGPVVNSERQLWSVAGYLSMVVEGVFGVQDDGRVQPKLPAVLVPELFGTRPRITLEANGKRYVLERPQNVGDGLLVAGSTTTRGTTTTVELVAAPAATGFSATTADANARAPATPAAPQALRMGTGWNVPVQAEQVLWKDGRALVASNGPVHISDDGLQHCLSLTRREGALESLHSPMLCVGPQQVLKGEERWQFTAAQAGQVRLRLQYRNPNGPINTGVTAAVKQLVLQCPGQPLQRHTVTLPHSVAMQDSTSATFTVPKGQCTVALEEGFNMSALQHFAHYTGGKGGREGVLNQAQVQALKVAPVAMEEGAR